MKACVITGHGGPDVVAIQEVPDPQLREGEALVWIRAAALNHLDLNVRNGGGRFNLAMPHILGSDGSGTIADVGPGVDRTLIGSEVMINPGLSCGTCEFCQRGQQSECARFGIIGAMSPGVFAESASIPLSNLRPKPDYLSFEEAASLGIAYLTAWRMLLSRAQLRPGEIVLIHGIGGGVALAGLQIAKLAGAEVIVTSSSEEKLSRAREMGADLTINYKSDDVAEKVKDHTRGRGVDIAFDSVGAATWSLDFACVRKAGRIVICGVNKGAQTETNLQALYWNQLTILGSTFGSHEDFRLMIQFFKTTKLKPIISSTYPLDKAPEALLNMENAEQFGKIVLQI